MIARIYRDPRIVDYAGTVIIAAGQSLSTPLDGFVGHPAAIEMPAAWTGDLLTFNVSGDGVSWRDLYDTNDKEISYKVGAGRYVSFPRDEWRGVRFLRVRSGTAGSPINQTAIRVLTLVLGGD